MKINIQNILLILLLISVGFIYIFDIYFNNYYLNDYLISKLKILKQKETIIIINKTLIINNNNVKEEKCNPLIDNPIDTRVDFGYGDLYPKQLPLYYNNSFNFTCLNNHNKSYLILFWTKFFGSSMIQSMSKCPVNNCKLTEDKTQLNKSNAIIFHMRDEIGDLPKYRLLDQLWLFFLLESPVHSADFTRYNSLFNLSATYKSTSDFVSFYLSSFKYLISNNKVNNKNNNKLNESLLINKNEFAAAIISNCNDKSNRLKYINELKKYIPIKVYGKCGIPCPNNINCKEIISLNTKFFLSFENSLCKDYVTEKFFDILNYNIIPVVYGNGNYDHYIPKNAYINARDYVSPKELSDYLNYLNKNTTAYLEYFKWRKYLIKKPFEPDGLSFLCELCIKLNLDSYFKPNISFIADFSKFWNKKLDCIF
jgi:hypothetical protein